MASGISLGTVSDALASSCTGVGGMIHFSDEAGTCYVGVFMQK